MSVTVPTATVPPVGQPTSAAPPLAVSRTTEVVAEESTISTVGTSVVADAPLNVSVKPVAAGAGGGRGAREALDGVDRRADVGVAVGWGRPAPMTPEVWPLMRTLNVPVVVLKPVNVTVCCSLPPCSAFWMPAAVLFWPRTIGTLLAPLKLRRYESPLAS